MSDTITVPFDWSKMEPNGDFNNEAEKLTRLYASVDLGGARMHMEAIEVHLADIEGDEFGGQEWKVVNPSLEEELNHLLAYADYGPFVTHEINGRHYVIVLTPHCE